MASMAQGLAERGIASLRYQFPYMERGSKRPDSAKAAQETVRAAVAKAASLSPKLPLFAGGKSYGGRMTSQAQAEAPLEGVRGLVFLGFPLHAPGQPSATRAEHLAQVTIPMLFLQGTRDDLADLDHLKPVVAGLRPRATLKVFEGADHSFRVSARSGRSNAEVMTDLLDSLVEWIERSID
jgi:predicted alpha/beta-hydrolase family hydrolase